MWYRLADHFHSLEWFLLPSHKFLSKTATLVVPAWDFTLSPTTLITKTGGLGFGKNIISFFHLRLDKGPSIHFRTWTRPNTCRVKWVLVFFAFFSEFSNFGIQRTSPSIRFYNNDIFNVIVLIKIDFNWDGFFFSSGYLQKNLFFRRV